MGERGPILHFPGQSEESGGRSHKPLELLRTNLPSLKADITCPGLYISYNVTLTARGKLTNCKTMGVGQAEMVEGDGRGGTNKM